MTNETRHWKPTTFSRVEDVTYVQEEGILSRVGRRANAGEFAGFPDLNFGQETYVIEDQEDTESEAEADEPEEADGYEAEAFGEEEGEESE